MTDVVFEVLLFLWLCDILESLRPAFTLCKWLLVIMLFRASYRVIFGSFKPNICWLPSWTSKQAANVLMPRRMSIINPLT